MNYHPNVGLMYRMQKNNLGMDIFPFEKFFFIYFFFCSIFEKLLYQTILSAFPKTEMANYPGGEVGIQSDVMITWGSALEHKPLDSLLKCYIDCIKMYLFYPM